MYEYIFKSVICVFVYFYLNCNMNDKLWVFIYLLFIYSFYNMARISLFWLPIVCHYGMSITVCYQKPKKKIYKSNTSFYICEFFSLLCIHTYLFILCSYLFVIKGIIKYKYEYEYNDKTTRVTAKGKTINALEGKMRKNRCFSWAWSRMIS